MYDDYSFWSKCDRLSKLWNDVCIAERSWLRCNEKHRKSLFKSNYLSKRKLFDIEMQRSKRKHWFKFQSEFINKCNSHEVSFWKTIGMVGVGQIRKQPIPMQFFLGTSKYTPTASIFGELAWKPPKLKQWKYISAHEVRLVNMDLVHLNKRILVGVTINLAGLAKTGYTGQRISLTNLDCLNFAIFQILSRSHFRIAFHRPASFPGFGCIFTTYLVRNLSLIVLISSQIS